MNPSNHDQSSSASWWVLLHTRLPRYKALLLRRWWIVALAISTGLLAAAWRSNTQPVAFRSTARLVVGGKMALQEKASYSEEVSLFFDTQIQMMRSAEIQRRAAERLQSLHPELAPSPVFVEAAQFPRAAIFVLTATGSNAEYTQQFLDACIDEYLDYRKEMRSEKSENTVSALTDQLARWEKEVSASENELQNFQAQNSIAFLQEQGNSTGIYISKLNQQLSDLKTEYQLLELLNLDQTIDRKQKEKNAGDGSAIAPAGSDSVLGTNGPETDYLRAKQEIEVLKAKQAELSKVLRPKHPDMIQIAQDIARQETLVQTFRTQTIDQLKTRRESLALQIKNLEANIQELEAKGLVLTQKIAEYNKIKSKGERAREVYNQIRSNLSSVDMSKSTDQDMITKLESASPAETVKIGLVRLLVLGALAGLLVSAGILFLLDKIDDRMNSFAEFQSHFSEEVLAKIPGEPQSGEAFPIDPKDTSRVAFLESLRALRSSIFYLPVEGKPPKTFLITSAVPNEGKSTVTTNLAVTMSYTGAKVLLIDGDLRRGSIHTKLGLENGVGIGDVLKGTATVEQAIRATKIENLSFMSRGAALSNPGENYLGKKTDELLKSLYPQFDYILFDSSPVLVADDTTSLAPKIDATIFVIRFSFSSARRSRDAIGQLQKRQANLIGIVCNGVNQLMQDYYYNKYPEYYAVQNDAKDA
jgi:capsular exopolysaccharide synthesis family protein